MCTCNKQLIEYLMSTSKVPNHKCIMKLDTVLSKCHLVWTKVQCPLTSTYMVYMARGSTTDHQGLDQTVQTERTENSRNFFFRNLAAEWVNPSGFCSICQYRHNSNPSPQRHRKQFLILFDSEVQRKPLKQAGHVCSVFPSVNHCRNLFIKCKVLLVVTWLKADVM